MEAPLKITMSATSPYQIGDKVNLLRHKRLNWFVRFIRWAFRVKEPKPRIYQVVAIDHAAKTISLGEPKAAQPDSMYWN